MTYLFGHIIMNDVGFFPEYHQVSPDISIVLRVHPFYVYFSQTTIFIRKNGPPLNWKIFWWLWWSEFDNIWCNSCISTVVIFVTFFNWQCFGQRKQQNMLFIDRVALAKQGDNTLGSVRLSGRLWICLFVFPSSHGWTVWPLTLIFGMGIDLDLG